MSNKIFSIIVLSLFLNTYAGDCPLLQCTKYEQINTKEISFNGCGAKGNSTFLEWANKLGNFIGSDFVSCCNTHDICYNTCKASDGTHRSLCDKDFYSCMNNVCSSKYKGTLKYIQKKYCKLVAKSFFELVDEFGKCPYNSGQNAYCKCSD